MFVYFFCCCLCSMLSRRLNSDSTSIISLSSFDTISSSNDNQFISFHNNTNNNKNNFYEKQLNNTKSFVQTIDQAAEYFEQILDQCTTLSNTSPRQKLNQQENKKRDCEEFLRSLNKKQMNYRQWDEEQNQSIAKYYDSVNDNDDRTYLSKPQDIYGSTFYCRKAFLQKSDGTTYICIRKRFI